MNSYISLREEKYMKKILALLILVLILAVGCTKKVEQTEEVSTPLDESFQNSEQLDEEFDTEEIEAMDQDINTLDEDLSNL